MKSLTYKLALIFLAMTVVPLVIGIGGALALQTAERSLDDNNQALQRLAGLLASAGDSLEQSARLQTSASQVTSRIASAQDETSAALKDMGDSVMPRAFAISKMRYALAEATAAERALLLTLNMRHLDLQELQQTRDQQLANIYVALGSLDQGKRDYLALPPGGSEERQAWENFEQNLAAWQANHEEFMVEIASLEALVSDLIRGGPLFASSSRRAYDTAFVSGRNVRRACEQAIDELNQAIVKFAEESVVVATRSQEMTGELVSDLGRETDLASGNAAAMRQQIIDARAAANQAAEEAALALSSTTRLFWYLIVFSIVGVIAAMAGGVVMAWRISKPIRDMSFHMSRLAHGDLTDDVPEKEQRRGDEVGLLARAMQDMIKSTRDEIQIANAMAAGDYTHNMPMRSEMDQLGRALGSMVRITNDALTQVSSAVDRVGHGSEAVLSASKSLSLGAQTSAAAVEEISQAVNQVDRQAQENATHAKEANQLATSSRDAARRGYDAVSELVSSMAEIQQAGKRIASVAKLIDDIAFQTNLLSLNAAVEAARAGRQGKGFSVVADEVRNLSGRSAKAARETSEMVAAMTERMEAGAQLAVRSDHEFREIVDATAQVAKLFEEIASASNAQSTAMAQIAQGLGQIDTVIQQNTQSAQQTADSADTLSRQADELRRMVSRFRLIHNRDGRQGLGMDDPRPPVQGFPTSRIQASGILAAREQGPALASGDQPKLLGSGDDRDSI